MADDHACRCGELAERVLFLERIVDRKLRPPYQSTPIFSSLQAEHQATEAARAARRPKPPARDPRAGLVRIVDSQGREQWVPGPPHGIVTDPAYLPSRPDEGVY